MKKYVCNLCGEDAISMKAVFVTMNNHYVKLLLDKRRYTASTTDPTGIEEYDDNFDLCKDHMIEALQEAIKIVGRI